MEEPQRIAGNMYAMLEMEFKQDQLYKIAAKSNNPQEYGNLIDDFMASLDHLKEYSTTDFADVYCNPEKPDTYLCNDSTMRRWLTNMNQYVEAQIVGRRNWKLNYQSMFRLRMLLIFKKNGFKSSTLQNLLGIKPSIELLDDDDIEKTSHTEATATGLAEPTLKDDAMVMFASFLKQLEENGVIRFDAEKGMQLAQPLALPGEIEERMQELEDKQTEQGKTIEELQGELNEQKRLYEIQQQVVNNISDIHEIAFLDDVEEQREELKRLRKEDPVAYTNAMFKLMQDARTKKKKGFFRRLFGG